MPKIARPSTGLSDVNVHPQQDGSAEITVCFMPDPDIIVGEGESRAVLAIDASRSLKEMYGGGPFGGTNYVEMVCRKLAEILAGITRNGKVSLLYWALSPGGADIEPIGEYDEAGCASADIGGPVHHKWGTGTKLLPVVKHLVEKVSAGSDWTMGVIVTDGIIEDEKDVTDYCMQIGEKVAAGKLRETKFVLIGVGEEVDEDQLERFDDMFEGTHLDGKVDLWSHGVAADMREERHIVGVLFGELMTEEMRVADSGVVLDEHGQEVERFPDGMPGKFKFVLPSGNSKFTVHTSRGDITQDIAEAMTV